MNKNNKNDDMSVPLSLCANDKYMCVKKCFLFLHPPDTRESAGRATPACRAGRRARSPPGFPGGCRSLPTYRGTYE